MTATVPAILRSYPKVRQWVSIDPDGAVVVSSGKVEFGQGIRTALAQLVAHELAVDPGRVRVAAVTTRTSPDEGVTSGSRSIEEANEALRRAAAALRVALLERAAARAGADVGALRTEDGFVVAPDGTRMPYVDLAAELPDIVISGSEPLLPVVGPESEPSTRGSPRPTTPGAIGHSVRRTDLAAKVFATPSFVQDIALPGMLHGRVCRPPTTAARLVDVDTAEVEAMAGVRTVVRDGSFLGVVAEREEEAIRAARRLRRLARWEAGAALPTSPRFLLTSASEDVVVADTGTQAPGPDVAAVLVAEYSRPFLAHASIGPSCAIAQWAGGRLRAWSHSQGIFHLRQELAKVFALPERDVEVEHHEGAGCYGANGADDAALDAALLARALPGSPVRVQWMRDDEFAWEPLGTAMYVRLRASLGRDGEIVRWEHDVWGNGHRDRPGPAGAASAADRGGDEDPASEGTNLLAARHLAEPLQASVPAPPLSRGSGGGRNADPFYTFPSRRVVNHYVPETPFRVSALRSLGAHANVFAIESFMDEIAAHLGVDPLEHRRRYLDDERALAVLDRVATRSGWRARERREGRGLGLAVARYKNAGAYVAVVAEVAVGDALSLTRVWAACDAGLVINPDGLANQIEGGIVQAASWTLHESVKVGEGGVETRGWSSYPIMKFREVPTIDLELVSRPDEPPCGIGEAVAGPTAAAIANAIHVATGIRLREMPFTRERFLQAPVPASAVSWAGA